MPTMPGLIEAVLGLATDLAVNRHALMVGGILGTILTLVSLAAPKRATPERVEPTTRVRTQRELASTLLKQEADPKSDARQLRAQAIGALGEALVTAELEKTGCPFLRNVILEIDGHTVQIDHIIRTPNAIIALEVKTYCGRVTGAEHDIYWTKLVAGRTYRILNPVAQNQMHVKALEDFLGDLRLQVKGFIVSAGSARFSNDVAHLIVALKDVPRTVPTGIRDSVVHPGVQRAWQRLQAEALLRESRNEAHVLYAQSRQLASSFLSRGNTR